MYNLLGKSIRGRYGLCSGIKATNADTAAWVIDNIPQIGIYVGKSTTVVPRVGNKEDIISQPTKGSLWNAVGFTNPGIDATVEEFRRLVDQDNTVFIMPQIGEFTEDGFKECISKLENIKGIDGYELNLSCPHEKFGGIQIGSDPEIAASMVQASRQVTKKPLIIKLQAGVSDLASIVKECESAGASAFSMINTIGGANPELSNQYGGLSGELIYPILLKTAKYVRSVTNKPLIFMGGIGSADQIRELEQIKEDSFYEFGTMIGHLNSEELIKFFEGLDTDLKYGTNNSQILALNKKMMDYEPFIVKDVETLSDSLSLIRFYENMQAGPGQFCYVKTAVGSKPFSVANDKENLELVVRNVGPVTESICNIQPHTTVRIRGPYGKRFSFNSDDKVAFVGAGCGIAPIHHAATHHKGEKIFFLGAKTKSEISYFEEFTKMGPTYIITEDGSAGIGVVTDLLKDMNLQGYKFLNCGPEFALREMDKAERQYAEPKDIYHLIERMMSCGIGVCGKCSTPRYENEIGTTIGGQLSCTDGPIFSSEQFKPGLYTRDKTGKRVFYEYTKF